MDTLCEACEAAPVEVIEDCDHGAPYRVCEACHARLVALALRPVEWFNLAKRHGPWQFLLHDDFYDEDGTAYQAEQPVLDPELYPAPALDDVKSDPNALLDFTITRWFFRPDVAAAWQALSPTDVLHTIVQRYSLTDDIDIQSAMLDVAACSLGESGKDFVTSAWNDYREPRQLGTLAQASAACLPYEDGFSRVVNALSELDEKARRGAMYALSYFHSRDSLDWIEANVTSPVTEDWGRLAAASRLDWGRAVSWLETGRLVSLVALDALAAIVRPQSPLLRDYGPQLEDKPQRDEFEAVLKSYQERDAAPRVKMTIRFLIENAGILTHS